VELEHKAFWAIKQCNFDYDVEIVKKLQEIWNDAYENARIYKEKIKSLHDIMIIRKEFHVRDKVFLYHSCFKLFSRKLCSHLIGPFVISNFFFLLCSWDYKCRNKQSSQGQWASIENILWRLDNRTHRFRGVSWTNLWDMSMWCVKPMT
jgi:hypothetical protein